MGNTACACMPDEAVEVAIGDLGEACKAVACEHFRQVFIGGSIYALICAVDYSATPQPMRCTTEADKLASLAHASDARLVHRLYNSEATALNTRRAIQRVGSHCGPGDHFVFYFAGRRARPEGGAFCFLDAEGQSPPESWLLDGDFTQLVTSSVHPGARILVILDCDLAAGAALDLWNPSWTAFQSIQIVHSRREETGGCARSEASFADALLCAVDKLNFCGEAEYSIGRIYREILKDAGRSQNVAIQSALGTSCDSTLWPLVPPPSYHVSQPSETDSSASGQETSGHASSHAGPEKARCSTTFSQLTCRPDAPSAATTCTTVPGACQGLGTPCWLNVRTALEQPASKDDVEEAMPRRGEEALLVEALPVLPVPPRGAPAGPCSEAAMADATASTALFTSTDQVGHHSTVEVMPPPTGGRCGTQFPVTTGCEVEASSLQEASRKTVAHILLEAAGAVAGDEEGLPLRPRRPGSPSRSGGGFGGRGAPMRALEASPGPQRPRDHSTDEGVATRAVMLPYHERPLGALVGGCSGPEGAFDDNCRGVTSEFTDSSMWIEEETMAFADEPAAPLPATRVAAFFSDPPRSQAPTLPVQFCSGAAAPHATKGTLLATPGEDVTFIGAVAAAQPAARPLLATLGLAAVFQRVVTAAVAAVGAATPTEAAPRANSTGEGSPMRQLEGGPTLPTLLVQRREMATQTTFGVLEPRKFGHSSRRQRPVPPVWQPSTGPPPRAQQQSPHGVYRTAAEWRDGAPLSARSSPGHRGGILEEWQCTPMSARSTAFTDGRGYAGGLPSARSGWSGTPGECGRRVISAHSDTSGAVAVEAGPLPFGTGRSLSSRSARSGATSSETAQQHRGFGPPSPALSRAGGEADEAEGGEETVQAAALRVKALRRAARGPQGEAKRRPGPGTGPGGAGAPGWTAWLTRAPRRAGQDKHRAGHV